MKEKENTPHGPSMEGVITTSDDTEKRDLDVHSDEFKRREALVFGRQLKYGDGPIDFRSKSR